MNNAISNFTSEELLNIPEDSIFFDFNMSNKKILIDGKVDLFSDDWIIYISDSKMLKDVELTFEALVEEEERKSIYS